MVLGLPSLPSIMPCHGLNLSQLLSFTSIILVSEILLLVEQIRPTTSQIDDLRTTVTVLLQSCALETVEGIRDSLSTTNDAFVLIVAKRAFVANSNEGCGTDVGVAYRAFAIAFVAEPTDGYAGCLAAHDEIGVMSRHSGALKQSTMGIIWGCRFLQRILLLQKVKMDNVQVQ